MVSPGGSSGGPSITQRCERSSTPGPWQTSLWDAGIRDCLADRSAARNAEHAALLRCGRVAGCVASRGRRRSLAEPPRLAPLTRMADAVRGITEHDLGERLPVPGPHDELHELAASFNGLMTRLQESFERQKRFTGEASHQLRTPLSVMLGQMEVALRRDRPADDYRHALTTVHAQAGRLRGIVEALLFLSAPMPRPEPQLPNPWNCRLAS